MKIAVVGGCNVDFICRPVGTVEEATSNRARIAYSPGGVGRNIAENVRQLGCEVSLLTAAGPDMLGDYLRQDLAAKGIETVCIDKASTGIYIASLDQDGLMARAFCDMSGLESITLPDLLAAGIDFSAYDGVIIDANFSAAFITELAALLRKKKIAYALEPVSNIKAVRIKEAIDGALLLKPNRFEAQVLTGIDCENGAGAQECAALLAAQGAQNVIVSMGPEGFFWHSELHRELVAPPRDGVLVNETGAGDALFAAAFVALLKGFLPRRAAKIAARAAALTCAVDAAVSGEVGPELFKEEMEE